MYEYYVEFEIPLYPKNLRDKENSLKISEEGMTKTVYGMYLRGWSKSQVKFMLGRYNPVERIEFVRSLG